METTSLYTNIDDTKRRAAIERLEQRQLEESDEINTWHELSL